MRLWQSLLDLARFGGFGEGGVDRPALSEAEIAARAWLVSLGRAAGLAPFTDAMANLFLRLEGRNPDLPPLLIGSHIDSQPTGGRFDGTYGVMAGIEVLRALRDAGITPGRAIEVVAWTNEEGSRFAPGMAGSAVFAGARPLEAMAAARDAGGIRAGDAVAAVLASDRDVPLRPFGLPVHAAIEAHIEQGPVLEEAGIPLGIVSGIQGKRTFRVTVTGEENHAGTAPRSVRRDALLSAVAIIAALERQFRDSGDILRFTVGRLVVAPNAPSVVPARVEFSIDLRHPDAAELQRQGDLVAELAQAHAGSCGVEVAQLLHDPPLAFDTGLQDVLSRAARELGVPAMSIASGAGHDARHLAAICPTAMLFVPCVRGISHHPAEYLHPDHARLGAMVLAQSALELARGSGQNA